MNRDLVTWLGFAAGTLTTLAFLPQVIKTWKTRSAKDISTAMYPIFMSGVALWLAYGVLIGSPPIIIANAVTLAETSVIVYIKIKHG